MNNSRQQAVICKLMNPVPVICDRRPAGQQEKVFQHAVSESNMTIVSFDTIISEPPYTIIEKRNNHTLI